MPHDLLTLFSAKAIEYPLALLYLVLFIPFWRFVNPRTPAAARASGRAAERTPSRQPAWGGATGELFALPDGLRFHPGHTWARADGDIVTVGVDDFGQTLVGPIARVALPPVGSAVAQGEKAWTLVATDARAIDLVSPVDGTVIEVNERAAADPCAVTRDPYGEGWLLRVRSTAFASNARQLMAGSLARRWLEDACDRLCSAGPELGRLALDGGTPVPGGLRAADPERWDERARTFFLF